MNPYARLTEIMEERGAALNGYDMVEATVSRISPLEIIVDETHVSVNLFCNPALMLGLNPLAISTDESGLRDCLNSFYSAFKLNVGDKVLVQQIQTKVKDQVKSIFYVICKVVAV